MGRSTHGFLENLYAGTYVDALYRHDFTTIDERRVEGFIRRYQEATKDFDVRALEESGNVPAALMDAMRAAGTFGLLIPESYGGLGFTVSEYLRTIEIMAGSDMALVLVPLAHLSIGIKGILLFGNDDQKQRYLPRGATGEMIFGYALTEPNIGSDAQHIETEACLSADGAHYVLNGTKTYITNANYAGAFTVFAQLDTEHTGNMGAFIVERDSPGLTVGKDVPKMGLKVSSTAMIQFHDVRVPRENLLGQPGEGFKVAMNVLNYGRLALGATSAGLMKRSLADMTNRSTTRKQFGAPLRQFELIQEKLVNAQAHALAASAMTYFTAALLEQNPLMNVGMETSHCKLYGTTRCWDTLYDALQTAGGSGYLSTQPYEKRMRDFRVTTIFEGTSEIHSLYPALTLFRAAAKELKSARGMARLVVLRRLTRVRRAGRIHETHPLFREAVRTARGSERHLRRLLRYGLLEYGKTVVEHEFFLRRITHLSLSAFWLLASLSYLRGRFPKGDYPASDLASLRYLTVEALEMQRASVGPGPTPKEDAHRAVMAQLV